MSNRWGVTGLGFTGLALLAASCGSTTKPDTFMGGGSGGASAGTGNRSSSGGKGSTSGGTGGSTEAGDNSSAGEAGALSGTAGASALAPQVTITNPVAASNPNVGPVVLGDQITVLCSAKQSSAVGAKPVDASTVKIAMLDGTGNVLKTVNGATTENANEYSALFVLTSASSGVVSFMCTANDTAAPVNQGSATVDTLIDRGPTITPKQPVPTSPHNLLSPMDVEFTVAAAPIADGDTQADVSGVTLQVAGQTIANVSAKGGGLYQASVDFTNTTIFSSPPSGTLPVLITATNKRTSPGKATSSNNYNFVLDGSGPVITVTAPPPGQVIGPASVLTFSVTDTGSGVDSSTVAVKLNDTTYLYTSTDPSWTVDSSGNYTYKMGNTLSKDTTDSQITVNVLATDNAQNASKGNSRLFSLDNRPPVLDLDPPATYFTRAKSDSTLQCSDYFDPVGSDAPNDLSTITNFGRFRSIVWDMTNATAGQKDFFYALTDQSSVRLYVQPDTTQPLLQDSDKDGICDDIWTGSIPHQKNPGDPQLQFVTLTALPSETSPSGSVNWAVTPALEPTAVICTPGTSSTASSLCAGHSDMTIIIHHPVVVVPHEPVIYAVQPDLTTSTSPICTGDQWQVSAALTKMTGSTAKLGWICMAARAVDSVGNAGISAPLRICLDDGSGAGTTICKQTAAPSCTDNCTPPPHFQVPPVSFDSYD